MSQCQGGSNHPGFPQQRTGTFRYYQKVQLPDESYYHTILASTPGLKLSTNNWRYIDWSQDGAHPKVLGSDDLPQLFASSAHFARKFYEEKDAQVLDELDVIIDCRSSTLEAGNN